MKQRTFYYEESLKAKMVLDFTQILLDHINYTVSQYEDADKDIISTWTPEKVITNIERYLKRFDKNSRPGQEKLDIIKMVDYLIRLFNMDIKISESIEQKLLKRINENKDFLPEDIRNEINYYFSFTGTDT